jgi:integrase
MNKPSKPTPDFPLFPHASKQWAKKVGTKTRYFGPWSDPDAALARYQEETNSPKKIASSGKPAKPHPDFPLGVHPSGQWSKRIRGKLHYFGPWADPEAALAKYLKQKDDLHAGRKPSDGRGVTVGKLVAVFLAAKKSRVESGPVEERLSPRTLNDYERICNKVKEVLGESQVITSLAPSDFSKLKSAFAETHGIVALGKDISVTRILFKYAFDKHLLDRPLDFGTDEFKKPSKLAIRRQRREKGKRMFQADELRRIIDKAGIQLRAMIYLGINCGLGNHDCEMLPMSALVDGWLDYPRPKTEVDRRCPLWPETIEALRVAMEARPTPKDPAHKDRVFITRHRTTWEPKSISDNPVSKEMVKVLKALELHRPGLSFYALRHTFQTIAEKSRDNDAVRYIMGHVESSNDMGAVYSEEAPDDARLQAVTDYVRAWLLAE